ncbi:uncharacterized protein LOC128937555 [Melozone crissalis]|uniref:uncharacterized protein LOC128937555 n=1 Tax=Melozone crissalis TaxID=40204 RepID=UPI0023DCD33A|nr:uncharacterized protein LOC128937555 [Melozone crissalis]
MQELTKLDLMKQNWSRRTCHLQTQQPNAAATHCQRRPRAGSHCPRPPGQRRCPGAGRGCGGTKRGAERRGGGSSGAPSDRGLGSGRWGRDERGASLPGSSSGAPRQRRPRPHGPGAAATLGAQPGGGIRSHSRSGGRTRGHLCPVPPPRARPAVPPAPSPGCPASLPLPASADYLMSLPQHGAPSRPVPPRPLAPPACSEPLRTVPLAPRGASSLPARQPPRSYLGYRHRPARRCRPPSQFPSGDCRVRARLRGGRGGGIRVHLRDRRTAADEAQGG